jgi:hypothetical protein
MCRGLTVAGAQTLNRRGLDSGRGLKENAPDYVIRAAPKIREKRGQNLKYHLTYREKPVSKKADPSGVDNQRNSKKCWWASAAKV